ncbi:MAG: spherulation-specific family 4 protein, partial [Gallionella sp.]
MTHAQSRRTFLNTLGGLALASLTGCGGGGGGTNSTVLSVKKTPLLIPAYFYNTSLWAQILPAHTPSHNLIVNVQTGPGVFPVGATPVPDSAWQAEFTSATANGHTLLGYVDTNYGAKTAAAVQAEVTLWKTLYGIQNIFFDRVGAPIG